MRQKRDKARKNYELVAAPLDLPPPMIASPATTQNQVLRAAPAGHVALRAANLNVPPPRVIDGAPESPASPPLQHKEDPLVAAIKARLTAGHRPGVSEQWERFCDEVRKSCGVKETDRGYGDRTIERRVRALSKQDK